MLLPTTSCIRRAVESIMILIILWPKSAGQMLINNKKKKGCHLLIDLLVIFVCYFVLLSLSVWVDLNLFPTFWRLFENINKTLSLLIKVGLAPSLLPQRNK